MLLQEKRGQPASSRGRLSSPEIHNSFGDTTAITSISDTSSIELQSKAEAFESSLPGQLSPRLCRGPVSPSAYVPTVVASLTSPPGFPVVGGQVSLHQKKKITDSKSQELLSHDTEISDTSATFPGLSVKQVSEGAVLRSLTQMALSKGHKQNMQPQFIDKSRADKLVTATNYNEFLRGNRYVSHVDYQNFNFDRQMNFPRRASSLVNLQSLVNPTEFAMLEDAKIQYQGDNLFNMVFLSCCLWISSYSDN